MSGFCQLHWGVLSLGSDGSAIWKSEVSSLTATDRWRGQFVLYDNEDNVLGTVPSSGTFDVEVKSSAATPYGNYYAAPLRRRRLRADRIGQNVDAMRAERYVAKLGLIGHAAGLFVVLGNLKGTSGDEISFLEKSDREARMYRHDNPLQPRTDTGLWIGGTLALAIVLGIILYGVTRTGDTATNDRPAPMSSPVSNR